jgi:Histidine phosphatase superfamily (branch 2)
MDLLSRTGRTQAFNLGEAFAEQYAFELLNKSHIYRIEYGGITLFPKSHKDQNRVEETARWFALGFWGINASDYVSFLGIPETPGENILGLANLDAGARSLQQYLSCPKFHQHADKTANKVHPPRPNVILVEDKVHP